MTKFTKGPWLKTERTFVYALGPKQTNVFFCDVQAAGKERASKDECEANAALIAAAPELYEAVDLLLADIEIYSQMTSIAPDTIAQNRARAALAKARGES